MNVGLTAVLVFIPIFLFVIHHNAPRCQVEAMLRDRACPSCLHNMKGASEESDGCTCCPECGAAWIIPDSTNQHRLPQSSSGQEAASLNSPTS